MLGKGQVALRVLSSCRAVQGTEREVQGETVLPQPVGAHPWPGSQSGEPAAGPFPRLTGAGPWSGHEVHFSSSSFCIASGVGGAGAGGRGYWKHKALSSQSSRS